MLSNVIDEKDAYRNASLDNLKYFAWNKQNLTLMYHNYMINFLCHIKQ